MNIDALVNNLDKLDGVEREEAEKLLTTLGIPFARKPKPSRAKFTTKLKPYYERVTIVCRTCAHSYQRHFYHTEQVLHGQHSLVALASNSREYEAALLTLEDVRKRKSGLQVCDACVMELSAWTKEELVATLLAMRLGEDFKKVEVSDA